MTQGRLKRANPNTIQDKLLVGYQGWFMCAGDGQPVEPGHHGWLHWFNSPVPNGGRPNVDLWPDTSEYDPSELYAAPGLATQSGDPVYLFSSRNPKTVRRHFHWMALHGVDGAFLQRFAGEVEVKAGNYARRDLRDEVGDRVREAAEAEGRVFAIMYDVTGIPPDKIQAILEQDWVHLVSKKRILDSPSYLHENGRPVVTLWGFGFNGRNHTPELVRGITEFFRSYTPGGIYLVAGAPGHWRTSNSDADRDPGFVQVWLECFDAISPWTIGRFGNEQEAERWGEQRMKADAEYLKSIQEQGGRKVDYLPVVFPGGSGFNLSKGKWGMNDMRRNGGQFLWRQLCNARRAGVRTVYGAMWDEYDEGTVFLPVVPRVSQVPVHPSYRFIALDVDGHDLPSDWYMRIAGFAAEALHGERILADTFPVKELQDYWSTRPHYESIDGRGQGRADIDAVTRSFGEWQVSGSHADVPTEAPPPYSLEDSVQPGVQVPLAPQLQQQKQSASVSPGGAGRINSPPPPPVPLGTRPSLSHPSLSTAVQAAAIPVAAMAVASAFDTGNAQRRPSVPPPPVAILNRPAPPPHPRHTASPPLLSRPDGPVHMPEPGAYRPVSAYPHHAPIQSLGHARPRDEHARGRTKHRSRSRSSGSHSRSRSRRRRSSSAHRKEGSHAHVHHGHGHSLSPPPPSHNIGFPTPGGLHHAYSDSGYGRPAHGHGQGYEPVRHGSYTPAHAVPVGFSDPAQPGGPAPHAPYAPYGQNRPAYAANYPAPHQGFGGQSYQHGHAQQPSSSSPYYTSYVPGTEASYNGPVATGGTGGANGSGRGGIQGGIASALQTVESIAGRQTRVQLEKKVKSLSNSLNRFK